MSEWINHVKRFQNEHPEYSYKESMSLASDSYNKTGGSIKSIVKKGKKKLSK